MIRCLVVEASGEGEGAARALVEDLGFKAVAAGTAAEGLDEVRRSVPDLVLLDWDLPADGALDFLAGLVDAMLDPRPVTIVMAVKDDPEEFRLARKAGVSDYLLKPLTRENLASVLGKAGFRLQSEG